MLPNEFYHVYNHANGNENLFTEDRNYIFFLDKITHYLLPVVKIHAYCLMPNHFHLLVEIRHIDEITVSLNLGNNFTLKELENKISKPFSNMFNAYAQAYNKLYNRMGSLFMPSCKQKQIADMEDYRAIIHYIHTNPVHHGFSKTIMQWKFSSYLSIVSDKKTLLERNQVLNIFGGKDEFTSYHQKPFDLKFDIRVHSTFGGSENPPKVI